MALAILGVTGFTGRLVLDEARRAGLDVRLVGRRREALEELAAPGEEVRVADARDEEALQAAFAGATVIGLATSSGAAGPDAGLGIVLCLVAAVAYAVGVVLQKPAVRDTPALMVTWLACLVGAVVLLPFVPLLVGDLATALLIAALVDRFQLLRTSLDEPLARLELRQQGVANCLPVGLFQGQTGVPPFQRHPLPG